MAFSGITLGSPNTIAVGQNTLKSLPTGNVCVPRAGQLGEQIIQALHGSYYETTYRGAHQFAYAAGKTLTSANTTATGLQIYLPLGAPVNLAITQISIGVSVTSASMTGIALAYNAQTAAPSGITAATASGNSLIGGPAGYATAYSAATLANAPIPFFPLMHNTAAISTTGIDSFIVDLQGAFILTPGNVLSLSALGAASAASAVTATIQWEEIPV